MMMWVDVGPCGTAAARKVDRGIGTDFRFSGI